MPTIAEKHLTDRAGPGKITDLAHLYEARCLIVPDHHYARIWSGSSTLTGGRTSKIAHYLTQLGWHYQNAPDRGWVCPACRLKELASLFSNKRQSSPFVKRPTPFQKRWRDAPVPW